MYPLKDKASEGRINPKGIPYLYLTEKFENTLYEIKAKYRSYVTVSEFQLARTIDVIYFYDPIVDYYPYLNLEIEKDINITVLNEINRAFSKSVSNSDQTAQYVPTQVFAEIIKDEHYDGILYMSQFFNCYNLCLFNIEDGYFINSELLYIRNKYYEKINLTTASS